MSPARFDYAICNAGSEALLVSEVARAAPGSAPAYRRKGLVTFKLEGAADALPQAIFARVQGQSLGLARDAAEVLARADAFGSSMRLHVFARDAGPDGPEPDWRERAAAVEAELRPSGRFTPGVIAEPGDRVLDVIVAGDEPLLVGVRTQDRGWRIPGGRPEIALPEEVPSRAFLKLEEALVWSGLSLHVGETAVELGSAPGGAALALVRRGVAVIAVDPAQMDPRVLSHEGPSGARVRHLRRDATALRRADIDKGCTLLLCDMNVAPPVALRTVASLASWLRPSLRAAILTLKLNDQRMVDAIPDMLARVAALAPPETGLDVRATQLPSNRREICVVASKRLA